jgi:hypothetical protein
LCCFIHGKLRLLPCDQRLELVFPPERLGEVVTALVTVTERYRETERQRKTEMQRETERNTQRET